VTSDCDWRIADLLEGERPVSLYLVVPPSDISRTKPLVRLILNQIGRRLTEQLHAAAGGAGRQLLLMLDEFPALGRLDFFESALAFMAGYRIRAFLIAQSLNQIAKAYGENNAILDNCHVRVAFSTNDERTAKRISDALGTATEQRAMRNYAGHRLAPWLAHVMVSRQETSRQLLTPGEVMQLAPSDELVLVSGLHPIRARKLRYFEDGRFTARLAPPPRLADSVYAGRPAPRAHDWADLCADRGPAAEPDEHMAGSGGGLQQERHPALAEEQPAAPQHEPSDPLGFGDEEGDAAADSRMLSPLRALSPVVAAHAVNEGAGPDLLPSF
jgi:type IV secretion system protein VirD4